jgi:hypothetical protein
MTGFASFIFWAWLLAVITSITFAGFVITKAISLDYSQGLGGAFNQVWCGAMTCPK